jgi:hypothetical protein
MDLRIVENRGKRYAEAAAGHKLMQSVEDSTDLIGFCLENHVDRLMLYAENLSDRFFDLSSGEAGMLVQKFRNYRLRVAVVWSPDKVKHSRRFGEMAAEENQGAYFRMLEDRQTAEVWLLGN